MNKYKNSNAYKNGKFTNAVPWNRLSIKDNIAVIWKYFTLKNNRTPAAPLPLTQANTALFNSSKQGIVSLWLGHSSLMINIDGYKILTDPVFQKRVSLFGPVRYNGKTPVNEKEIKEIDAVIVSHNHYDHLNKFTIKLLANRTKNFIVPLGVGKILQDFGIPENKIVELDWWQAYRINNNLFICATPSQHFSGRGLLDGNKTLWASFVIKTDNHKIFFGGDSGYFAGFKEIGEKFGPFDMTFLECGAYDKNWHDIHMFPEETVKAHIDLRGNILHPIHWGTFNLALHSWHEPMERLSKAAETLQIRTAFPVAGGAVEFGKNMPELKWWKQFVNNNNK